MFKSEQINWGRIAWGWLVLGCTGLIFGVALTVSHYLVGMPTHQGSTGRLASDADVLPGFIAIAGGGGLFAALGLTILLLRRGKQ